MKPESMGFRCSLSLTLRFSAAEITQPISFRHFKALNPESPIRLSSFCPSKFIRDPETIIILATEMLIEA